MEMFDKEENTLRNAKEVLRKSAWDEETLFEAYKGLVENYEELLSDMKFITKISDRLQNKMNTTNENLQEKTKNLLRAQQIISEQNEELQAVKYGLEQKIQERTQKLQEAYEDLLAANAELDQFVYRAAHDIRGPIARLIGLANLALTEVQDTVAIDYIKLISENAEQMNYTLNRLLFINTIKSASTNPEIVDFQTAVEEALTHVSTLDNFTFLKIQKRIPINCKCYTDKESLSIMLECLLEFVVQHTLPISHDVPHVTISAHHTEDKIQVYVAYLGEEIAPQHAPFIFNMFYRLSNHSDLTGIELYTANIAAQKINSEICLISSSKKETILGFSLAVIN